MTGFNVRLFITLLILMMVTSCNSDKYSKSDGVEQRIIFQLYSVSYDAEKELLSASATLKENNPAGQTIQLTKSSSVTFNEKQLSGAFFDKEGYTYTEEFSGKLPEKLIFRYENNDGNFFENRIAMKTMEIKEKSITISRSQGVQLSFVGKLFAEDESLTLTLYKNNETLDVLDIDIPTGRAIRVSAETLSGISSGKYTGQFSRNYFSSDVNAMERGGWYEATYITKKIEIKIVD